MKKFKFVFYLLLTVVFCLLAIYPTVYWAANPHLTRMEVYQQEGWSILLAIPFGIGAAVLKNYR
jgi:TRAP-type C4-dicarboxylate transport system permease small subunit